jgi:hypothetical protein
VPDLLDEDVKAAIKAFEHADDLLRAEPRRIFGSDSQRKGALFGALTRKWKAWERSGPCMYRGCPNTGIARSHAIHRAGPIEQIAEQQHVLTPAFGQDGMTMNRVGVREASTFPGFCTTHEQLFSGFETTGQIADGHQTALQAFRTVCREIARKRHDVEHVRALLSAYRETRLNYFKTSILAAAPHVDVRDVNEKGNAMEELMASFVAEGQSTLQELDELYDELFQYVDSGSPEPCIRALNISPDIHLEIPVTLSGLGVLRYQDAAHARHRALCLLGIFPQGKIALTFVAAVRRHSDAVALCTKRMLSGFGSLHAMESWMVYGSDHWFIRPSAWEAIPESRRSLILKAIENVEYNIADTPPFSILDEARRRLIDCVRDHIDEADDRAAALKQLAVEEDKLNS